MALRVVVSGIRAVVDGPVRCHHRRGCRVVEDTAGTGEAIGRAYAKWCSGAAAADGAGRGQERRAAAVMETVAH